MKNTEIQALKLSQQQKAKRWKYEILFKQMLQREGIKFVWQQPFYTNDWFYVGDFFIKKGRILIELDGKQHNSSKRKRHDITRAVRLKKSGKVREIIRIKNSELKRNPSKVYHEVILGKLKGDSIN